ncbi:GcrA family cell cycle regulator [Blastochloris viridis]|nr:GcrA family cell cycle regulator [Blastochloris viridis]
MTTMSWNEERIELLKKLWADGLSASQIAAELGGITRNAVIGKVHRLGLSGRAKTPSAAVPRSRKQRTQTPPRQGGFVHGNVVLAPRVAPEEMPEVEPECAVEPVENVVPIGQRCTILDLTEATCRWPLGEPGRADFSYCGGRATPGLPYCSFHARIAYQPVVDRRRDRRVVGG